MTQTLNDGDRVLITDQFNELSRGDIVQFKYPADTTKFYVKRFVGLPGESIEIRDGVVFIDGSELREDYVHSEYNQAGGDVATVVVEENTSSWVTIEIMLLIRDIGEQWIDP